MKTIPDQDEEFVKIKVILLEDYMYQKLGLHVDKYLAKSRSILANIKWDITIGESLMQNKIKVEELIDNDITKFASEEMKEKRKKHEQDQLDKSWADYGIESKIDKTNGIYTCPKCKSKATDFYLMQTRSSDEPMTTFCTCYSCGKNWKF